MMKYDEVVNNIKSYWLAIHKTVKNPEFVYVMYKPTVKMSYIRVSWVEEEPNRIAEQIHSLVEGGKKYGLYVDDEENGVCVDCVNDGRRKRYKIDVILQYVEEFK